MRLLGLIFFAAVLTVSQPLHLQASTPSAPEIVKKAQEHFSGHGGQRVRASMKTVDASGQEKTYELLLLEMENGNTRQSLLRITKPATHAGTAILVKVNETQKDDVYLYLPQDKALKKITRDGKLTNFLGSELDLEQLSYPTNERFQHRLIGKSEVDKKPCWLIEHLSKSSESSWRSKMTSCVDIKNYSILEAIHYDRANVGLKKVSYRKHRKIKGQLRPESITIENVQTKRKTEFTVSNQNIGIKLSQKLFTLEQLRKSKNR